MKQHVVCCGLPIPESRFLYDALRSSMVAGVKSPAEDMPAIKVSATTKHVLTHRSEDIFGAGNIVKVCQTNATRPKLVIIVADLRRLLSQRDPAFPHQHKMGWDHAIERSADGVPSFTAPGVEAYANAILSTIADERLETLVIRSEQLLADPVREWIRIAAFTGIDFCCDSGPASLREKLATEGHQISSFPISPSSPGPHHQRDFAHVLRSFHLSAPLRDFMHQFGYGGLLEPAENMSDIASAALNETPGTVIGFYTEGSIYEQEARRLEASVRTLGLPIHIEAVPDHGTWLANVRAKPAILEELRRRIDGPMLYVDVDAVFHANPWPALRGYDQDAAFCVMRDGLARSGTVLINDSVGARAFLAEWRHRLDLVADDWDQFPLNGMLRESVRPGATGYTIGLLPVSMCYVFDREKSKLCTPPAVPVIEHLQASRENEDRLNVEGGQARLERRRMRITELGG